MFGWTLAGDRAGFSPGNGQRGWDLGQGIVLGELEPLSLRVKLTSAPFLPARPPASPFPITALPPQESWETEFGAGWGTERFFCLLLQELLPPALLGEETLHLHQELVAGPAPPAV